MEKKRESLQGLADELVEKNELIEDMRDNIKSLQLQLKAKDNVMVNRMLEEDTESMRRIVAKLQNVNDKLNLDVSKLREEKTLLENKNKELSKQNENLETQIKLLKEELFSFEHEKIQTQLYKKELELVSKKINQKLQKAKKIQKKLADLSKLKDSGVSTSAVDSEKKVAIESTLNFLQRS